eukprot:11190643-Prorocentrum_lima.AAC.1
MTSSLVGSEMCIRDRYSEPSTGGDREPPAWTSNRTWACRFLLGARDPVSYTHLTLPTICSV